MMALECVRGSSQLGHRFRLILYRYKGCEGIISLSLAIAPDVHPSHSPRYPNIGLVDTITSFFLPSGNLHLLSITLRKDLYIITHQLSYSRSI